VTVHHRDELDAVQRELRELPGCTVLIYDQTCATEKRRRRKRGTLVDPAKVRGHQRAGVRGLRRLQRAEQLPERGAGRDRVRPQAAHQPEQLQQGLLLRQGLLPELRHRRRAAAEEAEEGARGPTRSRCRRCPSPRCRWPSGQDRAWGIVVAGVGGTGVITIGQLLGMAAHLEGKGVVTQDAAGLAQKGGATWSHIQIAQPPDGIHTTKVDTAKADLVIACDAIVGRQQATLAVMREGRTYVALNTHGTPTAAFVQNPTGSSRPAAARRRWPARWAPTQLGSFDAEQVAVQLLGDSIYTNPLLLGYAWQQGRVPLGHAALMRAIELNGVQVENNKAAFEWGRRCAHDLAAVRRCSRPRR
jgi:indolepyruvate ferredoxin oxidoreductase